MALDPRINLMAQPVQTMGPVDQMNAMLALQGGLQKNRLIDLQMKKAQVDLESAPALARLNELVKLAEMQKNMRIEQDAAAKAAALREAQNLMQTGGYQPTPEFPNQPQVMLNEQAALEEARRQQAAGQPVRIAVPNQGKLQALLMQANPQQATAELLKQMNPSGNRFSSASPGSIVYDRTTGSPVGGQAPFAPRAEPAPVVRPVPNPNSPTGFSYEDMRRPGAPLAIAPAPRTGDALPKPGYRWNASGTEQELIPGSDAWMKWQAQKAKDQRSKQLFESTLDAEITNIDKLIGTDDGKSKPHRGLKAAVGPIDVRFPTVLPNTADAEALIQSLQSKASISGLQTIRGTAGAIGTLTEREWPRLEALKATLQQSQSYDQFVQSLKDYRDELRRIKRLGNEVVQEGAEGAESTGGWSIKPIP